MPNKTNPFENILMIVLLVIGLSISLGPLIWGHFRKCNILKHGIAAKAKIIDVADTGRRHNYNPVVKIRLAVTDNAGPDYLVEVTMTVSPVRLVKYQPGYVVTVKYDPKSPDRVAIDSSAEPIKPEQ
jgi:hypothetical protein